MGSKSSKGKKHQDTSQYGDIYFKTDKTAYYAGETVTGTIVLNLISHYPGNKLFLRLKGTEHTHLVQLEKRGDHHEEIKYSDYNEIIKQSLLVHLFETLSPGQFVIHFSFLLPLNLPPSFYQQGHRYLAALEYQLEVFLEPYQNTDPKMKYKQPVTLREKTLHKISEEPAHVTTQLKTCGCCKQGSNLLTARFEKNCYSPAENAQVSMHLDNSGTSLKNRKIVFALKQRLEVHAGGNSIIKEVVKVKQELPGIIKGSQTNQGSLAILLPRFPTDTDFKRDVDKKNPSKGTLLGFKENKDVITSTTRGSLISSSFFLEVSCPMSGCCSVVPKALCQIAIYSPDFQLPVVTAPQDWQPLTMDSINLVFPPCENGMNEPFSKDQNANMVEAKMIGNNQAMLEMAQTQVPGNPAYNQNYFQNRN